MIKLDEVTKIYRKGRLPALDKVSLEVKDGEFAFLIGPSGSGKSTLLSLLLREQKATSGKLEVAGFNLETLNSWKVARFRRAVGCVFQDFQLLPSKTVAGNVSFALEVTGAPAPTVRARTHEVLEMVGLAGKLRRRIDELSGGEQQRVAIARALANDPKLILADEPTGNLDPEISAEIMELLTDINQQGTTVLMATHDVDIVNTMQRRVLALKSGCLVRDQVGGSYREEDLK